MATTFSNQLQPSNSTDALFRLWCTFVRDAFLTGWVQTADTGQMNFATVTKPGAANTMQGYIIVRMDDSLQASFPVYAKVEFGSGNGAANEPGVQITLGTGSNGSGSITGAFLTSYAVNNSSNATGQTNIFSHSSVSPSHAAVSLFVHSTPNFMVSFSIERARDSSGDEVGTHVVLTDSGAAGSIVRFSQYLTRAGGTQATAQLSFTSILTGSTVSAGAHAEYASMQDVGFGLIYPISGTSAESYRPENPCLGYILTPGTFTTTDAVLIVYVYGVPHVYKRLGGFVAPGIGSNTNVSNYSVWQRYE